MKLSSIIFLVFTITLISSETSEQSDAAAEYVELLREILPLALSSGGDSFGQLIQLSLHIDNVDYQQQVQANNVLRELLAELKKPNVDKQAVVSTAVLSLNQAMFG